MPMIKAITIHQPWASLIASGDKQYETRGWKTKYRGPLAIHASKKDPCKMPLLGQEKLERYVDEAVDKGRIPGWCIMPTGAVIAIGELVNIWRICEHPGPDIDKARYIEIGAESLTSDKHAPDFGDYFIPSEKEIALGDWRPGRYAWEIRNIKILDNPYRIKGQQGLWNFDIAKLGNQSLPQLIFE